MWLYCCPFSGENLARKWNKIDQTMSWKGACHLRVACCIADGWKKTTSCLLFTHARREIGALLLRNLIRGSASKKKQIIVPSITSTTGFSVRLTADPSCRHIWIKKLPEKQFTNFVPRVLIYPSLGSNGSKRTLGTRLIVYNAHPCHVLALRDLPWGVASKGLLDYWLAVWLYNWQCLPSFLWGSS